MRRVPQALVLKFRLELVVSHWSCHLRSRGEERGGIWVSKVLLSRSRRRGRLGSEGRTTPGNSVSMAT